MIIVCPSCASQYTIDDARIGAVGRKVRCAACRESWFITAKPDLDAPFTPIDRDMAALPAAIASPPAIAAAAHAKVLTVEAAPSTRKTAARPAKRKRTPSRTRSEATGGRAPQILSRLAVAMTLLALLIAPLAIVMRAKVVGALPRTAMLFSAIGLPVDTVGLTIANVTSTVGDDKGSPVLIVSGTIANVGDRPIVVPPLAIAIEGEHGEPLYGWTLDTATGTLPAGETAAFKARLASPPPAGRLVKVRFRMGPSSAKVALR